MNKFGTKLGIVYAPIWMCYSPWASDGLHYNKQSAVQHFDHLGRKIRLWADPDLTCKVVAILYGEYSIRSGFSVQYCARLLGKEPFATNLTGPQIGKVMRVMLRVIHVCIEHFGDEKPNFNSKRLFHLVNVLMFHNAIMRLRSMNTRLVWPGGVEGPMFKEYESLSRDFYSQILQCVRDYDVPYQHIPFMVIVNKLYECLQMDKERNYGLVITSTSAQEHSQKIEKLLAKHASNYDYDEIIRHLHLYSAAFGLESVVILEKNLSELKAKNLNSDKSWYSDEDAAQFQKIIANLPATAKQDYERLSNHDWTKQFV